MLELTMTPYQYAYQNPIRYTDPTGMIAEEPKSNPDSFWHKITWSKAHRNAERYANKMRYGNNTVDVRKHDSGDWAVFTDYNDGLKNRSTFSSKGMINSQDYGVFVGDIDATLERTNTTFTYPANGSPSIGLPNPFQGKSQFDIVMVDTNPVMTSIASSVAPPLGFLAGGVETYVSARDGDYVGATFGAVMLGFSAKMSGPSNQWFRGANNKFTFTPGNTYSKTLGQGTVGFKWGASPKYLNGIPNPGMQKINQMFRRTSLPVKDNLGLQEAGHFHLGTR